MNQKLKLKITLAVSVFLLCIWTLRPSWRVLSIPQDFDKPISEQRRSNFIKENPEIAKKSVKLGLDLAGGTHIVVEVDDKDQTEDAKRDVLDRCLEILRNRIDQFGVSEPLITKSGSNRIVVDLAGVEAEAARKLIGSTALLEFKMVGEPSDFKSVLDKIDVHMKRQKGIEVDTTEEEEISDTVKAVKDLFGAEVTEDEEEEKKGEVEKAGDEETAESVESFRKRPFGSLLVGLPNGGVAVLIKEVQKAKRILREPDIRGLIPKKFQFLWGRDIETLSNGQKARELHFLKRRAEMTGEFISDAAVQRDMNGRIEVILNFTGKGPREFGRITGANVGKRMGIVLDSVVYSAPEIKGKITQGRASITGMRDFEEAKLLATTLRAGSLPAPMSVIELRSVGPTLGLQNIKMGMNSALIGFLLVLIFISIYYLASGFIAISALLFNIAIIGAVLGTANATLTLPGIAGIILTIGMAVDANVIIFERIKEELAAGRSIRGSIEAGYKKAFSAIFDANITTIATSFILYQIGTGPIKGFGLTLMIGIGASLFTALFVTRLIFDIYLTRSNAKSLSIGKGFTILNNFKFNWIGQSRKSFSGSIALLIICFGLTFGLYKGFNWGVEFTGGNVYQVQFKSDPKLEQVRKDLSAQGLRNFKVQKIGSAEDNEVLINIDKTIGDSIAKASVAKAIGNAQIIGEESVGPTIGKELKWAGVKSVFASFILIILYIWIRFGRRGLGFGVAAVVALVHDVFITWALFGALDLEISMTFIAAILTIVGYSLNDTIIIFDRVRENLELTGKEGFASKVNTAINQCVSRSFLTSFTTLLVVTVLAIFGGAGVREFAIAMIIGVILGTYSTNFIATPFVVWWDSRNLAGVGARKKAKI